MSSPDSSVPPASEAENAANPEANTIDPAPDTESSAPAAAAASSSPRSASPSPSHSRSVVLSSSPTRSSHLPVLPFTRPPVGQSFDSYWAQYQDSLSLQKRLANIKKSIDNSSPHSFLRQDEIRRARTRMRQLNPNRIHNEMLENRALVRKLDQVRSAYSTVIHSPPPFNPREHDRKLREKWDKQWKAKLAEVNYTNAIKQPNKQDEDDREKELEREREQEREREKEGRVRVLSHSRSEPVIKALHRLSPIRQAPNTVQTQKTKPAFHSHSKSSTQPVSVDDSRTASTSSHSRTQPAPLKPKRQLKALNLDTDPEASRAESDPAKPDALTHSDVPLEELDSLGPVAASTTLEFLPGLKGEIGLMNELRNTRSMVGTTIRSFVLTVKLRGRTTDSRTPQPAASPSNAQNRSRSSSNAPAAALPPVSPSNATRSPTLTALAPSSPTLSPSLAPLSSPSSVSSSSAIHFPLMVTMIGVSEISQSFPQYKHLHAAQKRKLVLDLIVPKLFIYVKKHVRKDEAIHITEAPETLAIGVNLKGKISHLESEATAVEVRKFIDRRFSSFYWKMVSSPAHRDSAKEVKLSLALNPPRAQRLVSKPSQNTPFDDLAALNRTMDRRPSDSADDIHALQILALESPAGQSSFNQHASRASPAEQLQSP